jgi:hypothetical protein
MYNVKWSKNYITRMMGMIAIETTQERIESQGGLILVGMLAEQMGIPKVTSWENKPTGAILTQIVGMLTQGEISFEASRRFREDEYMKESLRLKIMYAPEILRIYLESMCDTPESVNNLMRQLQECSNRLLSKADITPIIINKHTYIPLDFDSSPFNNENTKKENIGYTYKGFVGYHPMFAYLGVEGYLASCELRPGIQHCQNDTSDLIKTKVKTDSLVNAN